MATTTNYGWTTPDDTALVKDGAAAIRTLGSSVDTTTKALNPSTTLGDIEYRSSTANTNTRLGIGTSGQALTVVAGAPSWAASPTSVLTTTGDTLYASAANTLARLGIGSTGNVLTVAGGVPTWAAPAGGAGNLALITSGSLSGTSLSVSSLSTYTNISCFFDGVTWGTSDDDLGITINGNTSSIYRQAGFEQTSSGNTGRQALALAGFIYMTRPTYQTRTNASNTYLVNLSNCKNTGYTSFSLWSSYVASGSIRYNFVANGVFEDNSAVSSISFFPTQGYSMNAGTYRIYGE
jgi:hypothetical protein